MSAPAIGNFDVVFSAIVGRLRAYADEMPEGYEFDVYESYFRMVMPERASAAVYVGFDGINPQTAGSGGHGKHYQMRATYNIDCVVMARGLRTETYERADKLAAERLRMLIQQVMNALYNADAINLGLPIGTIGSRPSPTVTAYDHRQIQSERPIVGARIAVPIEITFEPEGVQGTPFESLVVTEQNAPAWGAIFEYEEVD